MKFATILAFYFTISLFSSIASSADPVVQVKDAWIREAPPNASTLAGYMAMANPSNKDQSLVSATTSAFGMVMIHRTEHKGGMAHMRLQKQVTIPAKGKVMFAPGDYHLMLMNPKQALHAGDQVNVNLVFDDDSQLEVAFKVRKGMEMKPDMGGMKNDDHSKHMKCR